MKCLITTVFRIPWLRFEIVDKPVMIAGGFGLNSRSIEALDQNGNSILPELPYETAMAIH